jgi:alpha-tubulin suppressor-like RCC1 family protein
MKLRQLLAVFARLIAAMPLAASAQGVGDKPAPHVVENQMSISIYFGGSGWGQVAIFAPGEPGDYCNSDSDCTNKNVTYGLKGPRTITLTATPPASSLFAGWAGDCSGTSPTCDVPISRAPARVITYFRSKWKTVAVGAYHTCALHPAGDVVCWGLNADGQSGAFTTMRTVQRHSVPYVTNAVAIAAGGYHTCALILGGSVQCWGNNWEGELGLGAGGPQPHNSSFPVVVPGITDAVAVTAGGFHTCVVKAGGQAFCWGRNGDGQLGDNTQNSSPAPVPVLNAVGPLSNIIAAGGFHTCAIVAADRTVACWGRNSEGQLGIGGNPTPREPPGQKVKIDPSLCAGPGPVNPGCSTGLLSASTIAASIGVGQIGAGPLGGYFTAAVDTNNQTFGWGYVNDLLAPQYSTKPLLFKWASGPGLLINPGVVSRIGAGAYHMCINSSKFEVLCVGNNDQGQSGSNFPNSNLITLPLPSATAVDVGAGGYHTCAVFVLVDPKTGIIDPTDQGSVGCWGEDGDGQVDGTAGGGKVFNPLFAD